jgi:nucleoid DNA-binding protein
MARALRKRTLASADSLRRPRSRDGLTRTQLADAVAEKAGMSRADAKKAITALEEVVIEEIGKAEKVKIGGIVQIEASRQPARQKRAGRNPATGETITIAAKPASVAVKARPLAKAIEAAKQSAAPRHGGRSRVDTAAREVIAISEAQTASSKDLGGQAEAVVGLLESAAVKFEELVVALSPEDVIGRATLEQARLNAGARAQFLREWPTMTSSDVADFIGSTAANRAAAANKLATRGSIFAVRYRGTTVYPRFQFDDVNAQPRPAVGDVVSALRNAGLEGWEIAFWFVTPNGWLNDDVRPVDELDADPKAVVAAAEHEADVPE